LLDRFKFDENGSVTLYLQDLLGIGVESNGLAASGGFFYTVIRIYLLNLKHSIVPGINPLSSKFNRRWNFS
jgi:hypothetical protein